MPVRRVQITRGDTISARNNVFQVVQQLRAGGNAVSFVAICSNGPLIGLTCVLKVFDNLDEEIRLQHFFAEGSLLKDLDHPAVLKVLDDGEITQSYRGSELTYHFYVTRLYGNNLLQRGRERALLPEKLLLATQLLSAINYLGSLVDPIIHRDIKPANIFIEAHTCVLGDFGLFIYESQLVAGSNITAFREAVAQEMPVEYRVPDLFEYSKSGRSTSSAANTFQLGLVLAELFTGMRPAIRPDALSFDTDRLPTISGTFGDAVRSVIQAMLFTSAEKRATPGEALEVLAEIAKQLFMRNIEVNGRFF